MWDDPCGYNSERSKSWPRNAWWSILDSAEPGRGNSAAKGSSGFEIDTQKSAISTRLRSSNWRAKKIELFSNRKLCS